MANTAVKIDILLRGGQRTSYTTYTNSSGEFRYTFVPTANEAGIYTVNATAQPSDGLNKTASATFEINGLYMQTTRINLAGVYMNTQNPVKAILQNLGDSPISGLSYSLVDGNSADGITASIDIASLPTTISPGASITVPVTITAPLAAPPATPAPFILTVTSPSTSLTERCDISASYIPAVSLPVITPSTLQFKVKTGDAPSTVVISVANQGYAPMTDVTLTPRQPSTYPWVSVQNPGPDQIDISQTKKFRITIDPQATLKLGHYTIPFDLKYNGQTLPFQAGVDILPTLFGNRRFKVNSDTGVALSSAKVHLINKAFYVNNGQEYNDHIEASTDASGYALFSNLPAGAYHYIVTASNHKQYEGELVVEPGEAIIDTKVLLEAKVVEVEFSVKEDPIQQVSTAEVKTTFVPSPEPPSPPPNCEPNCPMPPVPKPRIICAPTSLNLSFFPESAQDGDLLCSNSSNSVWLKNVTISSQDVDATERQLKVNFTATSSQSAAIGDIAPGGSVRIPYRAIISALGETRYAGNIIMTGNFTQYIDGEVIESTTTTPIPVVYTEPTEIFIPSLSFEAVEVTLGQYTLRYLGSSDRIAVKTFRSGVKFEADSEVNLNLNSGSWTGVFNENPPVTQTPGAEITFDISEDGPDKTLLEAMQAELNSNPQALLANAHYLEFHGKWAEREDKSNYRIPINITVKRQNGAIDITGGGLSFIYPSSGGGCTNCGGWTPLPDPDPGVIKLEIEQKISIERQAFNATLKLKPAATQLENVNLQLKIMGTDALGKSFDASQKFFVIPTETTGIVNGIVSGPAQLTWQIIPSSEAGGKLAEGMTYSVSATIDYKAGDKDFSLKTQEEQINVKPMPRVLLAYELPRRLEAGVPGKVRLRMINTGYGSARNLTVVSAQPKIIENTTGLPVDFTILGSSPTGNAADYVNGAMSVRYEEVAPGQSVECYWLLNSTASGNMVNIDVSLKSEDYKGVQLDPLIESATITYLSSTQNDISSQVTTATSGFVYSRATKLYSGKLTVTNTGQATLSGPFVLWLNNLTSGVTLTNGNGSFNGYPHIDPATPVSLAPGQSFTVPLTFSNPANTRISFAPVTFN